MSSSSSSSPRHYRMYAYFAGFILMSTIINLQVLRSSTYGTLTVDYINPFAEKQEPGHRNEERVKQLEFTFREINKTMESLRFQMNGVSRILESVTDSSNNNPSNNNPSNNNPSNNNPSNNHPSTTPSPRYRRGFPNITRPPLPKDTVTYSLMHPDTSSSNSFAPLFTDNCIEISSTPHHNASQRLAVLLITANRPDHVQLLMESFKHQSVDNFDLLVFVDHVPGDKNNQKAKDLLLTMNSSTTSIIHHLDIERSNQGVARMSLKAILTAMDDFTYDRFMLIEDDHLIGHTYIEGITFMLNAAQHLDEVAVVSGNQMSTPQHHELQHYVHRKPFLMEREHDCMFQLSKLYDIYDLREAHNIWAWATTRSKWKKMEGVFRDAFKKADLHKDSYGNRNWKKAIAVMKTMCPTAGLGEWNTQDWLRACAFYNKGMRLKLQPTNRLMSCIGKKGIHMKPELFDQIPFNPVDASDPDVSRDVSEYPNDLCWKTCLLSKKA